MAFPRPVRVRVVALLLVGASAAGCASTLPPTTYVPERGGSVQTMRRAGTEYAAVNDPQGPVLLSLEPVGTGRSQLLRLKLHIQNRREQVFVLDPERDVFLERRVVGTGSTKRIAAEPADEALRLVGGTAGSRRNGDYPLRRTRIPPGESVRGAVYFRGTGVAPKKAAYGYEITVHLRTPAGRKRVLLRPMPSPS